MKKLFLFLLAISFANVSFGQKPTTLKENNLNGNVLLMSYGRFVYEENFGEPKPGRTEEMYSYVFNGDGYSVLQRIEKNNMFADSYLQKYELSDGNRKIVAVGISSSIPKGKLDLFDKALTKIDNSYESEIKTIKDGKFLATNRYEYTYDSNNVLVRQEILGTLNYEGRIEGREIGKQTGNGTYDFTIYRASGESMEKTIRTYVNGLLTVKKLNQPYATGIGGSIEPDKNGTYKYDKNGHLISFIKEPHSRQEETKYVYNDKGDILKVIEVSYNGSQSVSRFYENYKYDSHGNWIYRTYGIKAGIPKYIEKREIIYGSDKDDVNSQADSLVQSVGEITIPAQSLAK